METLKQALKETKRWARLDSLNYGTAKAYRRDARRRDKQRKEVLDFINNNYIDLDTELKNGFSKNGRCFVKEGQINFIIGGYAPTEVYAHLLDYLKTVINK